MREDLFIMQPYETDFSEIYDILMEDIPYDKWADYIESLLKQYGIDKGLILELGCGTEIGRAHV